MQIKKFTLQTKFKVFIICDFRDCGIRGKSGEDEMKWNTSWKDLSFGEGGQENKMPPWVLDWNKKEVCSVNKDENAKTLLTRDG